MRPDPSSPPRKRGHRSWRWSDPLSSTPRQERIIKIPCYFPILNSRSRYLKAALRNAHVENQQKTVDIVLADDQAVEDLKLLIKLSCSLSYVEDSGVRLSNSTRLRLAFMANAFEFVDCVQECLQSLSEEKLTLEDASSLLDEMPEELWEHEAEEGVEMAKRKKEGEAGCRSPRTCLMNRNDGPFLKSSSR